jgi:GNAT superfamily N-acetyltransferase
VLTIRRFKASDQNAARALIEAGLGDHFGFVDRDANPDLVDIDACYSANGGVFFVADDDGRIVGTTAVLIEENRARLARVAVAKEHRRAGIATALLSHAIEFARHAGIAELIVHTQPEWRDATAFYRRHGFAPFGRDEVDVHLRRTLEPPVP